MKLLSTLDKGIPAQIKEIKEGPARLKLMELGCVPDASIIIVKKAAFNGPIAVEIAGYILSMRLEEASSIVLV